MAQGGEPGLMGILFLLPLRLLSWSYYLLPRELKRLAGRTLGLVLYMTQARASVVKENLQIAFPGENRSSERSRLFREAYDHLGNLFFEVLLLLGPMPRFIEESVEM